VANILSNSVLILDAFNPATIAKGISERMRLRRLELNLTQQALAAKTGVSLGSIKRFERDYEISLKHLLMIAVIMDSTDEFSCLFSQRQYQSIDEVLKGKKAKRRKRGRIND
jgi:transcriptional regulator with XRE-family HTH domain